MLLKSRHLHRRTAAGFTLIELMVGLTVMSMLLALAAPSFRSWIANARVRTVTQTLQDGVRLAQTEALRRNRQMVFSLTNAEPATNSTAVANGVNWAVHTIPMTGGETKEFVRGGSLSDVAGGVAIAGPAAICFNSAGRQAANASTGVTGATCTIDPLVPQALYNVSMTGSDRPLRVSVSLGGQVRMCDPARVLSASVADGC